MNSPRLSADARREQILDVAIDVFGFNVPTLLHNEITRLSSRGMRALVLDLRDNPGGEMDAFLRLADDFLEPREVLATVTDGDGDATVHRARQADPYSFPLVLLVNRGTASAAPRPPGDADLHPSADG